MTYHMKTLKQPANPVLRDIHIRLLKALNKADRLLVEHRKSERAKLAPLVEDFDFLRKANKHLEEENARLRAELEALTKA